MAAQAAASDDKVSFETAVDISAAAAGPPVPRMRVLIVGGGVSGLALGIALAQRNVARVTVIEKLPSFTASLGYVLGLWPMGCNALQSVGALEEVMKEGCASYEFGICKGSARRAILLHGTVERHC